MKRLEARRLLRLSQATLVLVQNWKEGVGLEQAAGASIASLMQFAAGRRWRLALEHRRQARVLMRLPKPLYRAATSRYYYAMYHAMRAAAYISHGGDDFEAHSVLPQHVPSDFPQAPEWRNLLKSAREYRNRADYDPHPLPDKTFAVIARQLQLDAERLLPLAKEYLTQRGCTL